MSDIRPLSSSLRTNADSRLCPKCQAIFTSDHSKDENVTHHSDGAAFKGAFEQGCYFCTWSWREYQLRGQWPISHTTYTLQEDSSANDNEITSWYLRLFVHGSGTAEPLSTMFRRVRLESDCQLPNYVQSKLEPSVRALQSLQVAKIWLENCTSNHPECQESKRHTSLPSRLVHVWQDATKPKIHAKIYRGETLATSTLYLSLSHCWGEAKFLTTTRDNICEFESSLPVEKLSRTFQDAFLATISLGFEYIWIDSLCIVQDDKDEWSRESKLMGKVYKNATCNISASAFANGEEGFMLRQRRLDPTPVVLNMNRQKSDNTLPGSCYAETYWIMHGSPWAEITGGSLFQRAWVLQEQLLAPRALHFGEDQMFWECKRTFANEVWPRGWPDTLFESGFSYFSRHNGVWQTKVADAFSTDKDPFQAWYKIVDDYSHRHVTIASDRLPALAGIASEFKARSMSSYLYGLWGVDIHRGLLFRQHIDYIDDSSALEPLWDDAPSWSWPALHNPVCWSASHWVSHLESIKISKIEMPTAIDERVLRLDGMLIPLLCHSFGRLCIAQGILLCTLGTGTGYDIRLYPDEWFFLRVQTIIGANVNREDFSDEMTAALSKAVVLVPTLYESSTVFERHCIYGLMLYAQPGLARGVYRRVGMGEIESKYTNYNTALAELRAYQEPLQNEWYHETDGAGNYDFSIV